MLDGHLSGKCTEKTAAAYTVDSRTAYVFEVIDRTASLEYLSYGMRGEV
jgi:hypothetical protein